MPLSPCRSGASPSSASCSGSATATAATLILRPGFVTEEFLTLSRRDDRGAEEERLLARWKLEMAERVMAAAAADVYAVEGDAGPLPA